jgi:hypothetical protein
MFSGNLPVLTMNITVHEDVPCTIRLARSAAVADHFDITVWSTVPSGLEVRDKPTSKLINTIWETTDTGFCVQQDLGNSHRLLFVSSKTFQVDSWRRLVATVQKRACLHSSFAGAVAMRAGM